MAKTAKAKKEVTMEEALWKSADKLRGSVEPAEYKHVLKMEWAEGVVVREIVYAE